MEMFELKYFLAVAQTQNVNRASTQINVSAGSLSKAISRLEDELQTKLFFKSGRGIRLTPEGNILKQKASEILQLEEDARFLLLGPEAGRINIYVSSEEILQSHWGLELVRKINLLFPMARIHYLIRSESDALQQVLDGDVHLGLITIDPPSDVKSKILAKVEFKTCASEKHPLLKKFGPKQSISVFEVIKHPFILPDQAVLGRIHKSTSIDGWRDDKFPREIKYKVCGLKLIENLVKEGLALGYLPDYFIESSGLIPLKISDCPYTCHQTIRLVTKDPERLGWLNRLWDSF